MKDSDVIFLCVHLLYYKYHNINLICGGSYVDFLDCIKNKKTVRNPLNDDNKCSQSTAKIALNHEEIVKNLQRISKIKPVINKYNWKLIIP